MRAAAPFGGGAFARSTKPMTASSETRMSNPAARAFSRHASTRASSATAAEIASVSSRASWFTSESMRTSTRRRAGNRRRASRTIEASGEVSKRACWKRHTMRRNAAETAAIVDTRCTGCQTSIAVASRRVNARRPTERSRSVTNPFAPSSRIHAMARPFARPDDVAVRPSRRRAARRVSLHARHPADDVPRPAVDDAAVRGLRHGRRVERALPVSARRRASAA